MRLHVPNVVQLVKRFDGLTTEYLVLRLGLAFRLMDKLVSVTFGLGFVF